MLGRLLAISWLIYQAYLKYEKFFQIQTSKFSTHKFLLGSDRNSLWSTVIEHQFENHLKWKFVSQIARDQIRHVSWWSIIIPLLLISRSNKSSNGKLIILNGEWISIKLGKFSLVLGVLKLLNRLSWEPFLQAADWILSNWLISSRMLSQHFACSIHPHQLVRISLVRIFRLCLLNCPPPISNRTDHSHVFYCTVARIANSSSCLQFWKLILKYLTQIIKNRKLIIHI